MTTRSRSGCRALPGTRTIPEEPGEFSPFDQSRAPEQPLLKCIRCPTGSKSKLWKARRVVAKVASGLPMVKGDGGSDDSSDEEEVEPPPRIERRSKLDQDRPSARDKATAQAGQSSKRPRISSPTTTEKAPKHPKVAEPKTRKALPKIKIDIPVAST
ncbi:hypothetical protein PSTG_18562 [Puccinia striiformis f. sp. tritici PST-78]|uniref:Uncharacterized protein n=1 Tax=Puccinia striiformis f. sp. tritici PST-78 TaxID=1165861 RepID=A0A0L0UM02_9BASI|nr:hypothetical protein PSTG_18562 [Puccinia striiformis f. sp. tritici PST-78]